VVACRMRNAVMPSLNRCGLNTTFQLLHMCGNAVTLLASARCCGLSDGLVPSLSTSVLVSPEIYSLLLPEESVCCCIFVVSLWF
jgi:hypothetical protein